MTIRFEHPFPDEFKDWVRGAIENLGVLLPCWVQEVCVEFNQNADDGEMARAVTSQSYRRLALCFGGLFFAMPNERRQHCLIHEIAHCYTTPIRKVASEVLHRRCATADENAIMHIALDEAMESCTEDIALLVERIWNGD